VRRVGYLLELYRDAGSPECTKWCSVKPSTRNRKESRKPFI